MPASAFHRRCSTGVVAVSVIAALFTLGTVQAAAADTVTCSSDLCDGGLWLTARGANNDTSYWGMDPGHNCTNYVAWRLIQDGVARPATNPGDATDWATNAKADGYLVDHMPVAGAIAQWDGSAGGNSALGHVAYVEKVNDDGTILISEDYWHGGDQAGPLTYRTVAAFGVSNFIHYAATSNWLREVVATKAGFQERGTGLNVSPDDTTMTGTASAPMLYFVENGYLQVAAEDASGWHATDTGLSSKSTTVSAVEMAGTTPMVMTVEGDRLFLNVDNGSSWQKMNTGIEVSGHIAAVDLGGFLPTVMVSQAGGLYRVWNDAEGWHVESTGVEAWGAITAVNVGGVTPEVYGLQNNTLRRAWWDSDGWHEENTGVLATGSIAAVDFVGGAQVMLLEDQQLFKIFRDESGWHKQATGVRGGNTLAVVPGVDPAQPLIVQAG